MLLFPLKSCQIRNKFWWENILWFPRNLCGCETLLQPVFDAPLHSSVAVGRGPFINITELKFCHLQIVLNS